MKADEKKALFVKLIEKEGFKKWKVPFFSLSRSEEKLFEKYCELYGYKTSRITSLTKEGCFFEMLSNYVSRTKKKK